MVVIAAHDTSRNVVHVTSASRSSSDETLISQHLTLVPGENVSEIEEKIRKSNRKDNGHQFNRHREMKERARERKTRISNRTPKLHRRYSTESNLENECKFTSHRLFPLCFEKAEYLTHNWEKDKCFHTVHKINGSRCSIRRYLTQAEPFCMGEETKYEKKVLTYATPRYDLKGLLNILSEDSMRWMRERATFIFPGWVEGAKIFFQDGRRIKSKRVIVFLGAFETQRWFLEDAGKGGDLGELIQWTDLITGLYIIGYHVTVTLFTQNFKRDVVGTGTENCPGVNPRRIADIIYTDLVGLEVLRVNCGQRILTRHKCTYRILDSFGTFTEHNYHNYPFDIPGGKSPWGGNSLLLPQYLTLYPHTHDNTFLGFVVNNALNTSSFVRTKKDVALLYAKRTSYLDRDSINFLKIVSEYFEIHATCIVDGHETVFPQYKIHNHGPVSGAKVQQLLSESKLFIGIGFPYEGPGPLEAMAAGAVFVQPKFKEPVSAINTDFFKGKPTLRKLKSQNPYMEEQVGVPYCYTIDITNETASRAVLKEIKERPPLPGKIPKEFKHIGMIERIYAITSKMNYCDPGAPRWPPVTKLQVHLGLHGDSCKKTCLSKDLMCESMYFYDINSIWRMEKYVGKGKCESVRYVQFLHAPSFDPVTNTCYLQKHGLLFSCMHEEGGSGKQGIRRLCPCRDHEFEQTAICKNCL